MQPQHDKKPTILLVDDNEPNLIALEAVLGKTQYHLIMVGSGPEALAALEQYDVAMVLLDIQMPGMDGYEVARRIKSSPKTKHIPIIFITAVYKEDPFIQKGYEAGAVDYFGKPFNPDLLRLKVSIYAELYQKNLALRQKEEEGARLRALNLTLEEREKYRQKESELRAAELKAILESIPDPIYVGDESGITRCNSSALEMFGFESCEELNQHFEQLADRIKMRYADSDNPVPPHDQPFSHALRGERHFCEMKIRHIVSGKDLVIACAAAPVLYQGHIIGAVVVNLTVLRAHEAWPQMASREKKATPAHK